MAHTPHHRNHHQERHQEAAEAPEGIVSPELAEKAEEAAQQAPEPVVVPFKGNVQPERWDPPPEHGDAA